MARRSPRSRPDEASDLIEAEGFAPGERQQISRSMLNQILQARAEQMIELICNEIRRSGYEGLLPAGVVITGGSAQLAALRRADARYARHARARWAARAI